MLIDPAGKTIRTKQLGGANIAVVGKESFGHFLKEMVAELLEHNSVHRIGGLTCGVAGAARKQESAAVSEAIIALGITNFTVMTDAELLYYTIFQEDTGILIESGTGSVCLIRNRTGRLEQIGGWGYLLGDEGSGYDIGRMAIRAALAANEAGIPPAPLTRELLAFFGIAQPGDLVSKVYGAANKQTAIASVAKLVSEQALRGEPDATRVIESAAVALKQLVVHAIERLGTNPPFKIALAGGNLQKNSPVAVELKRQLKNMNLAFEYLTPSTSPAAAAALHSLRTAGENVDEGLLNQLKKIKC
jgi:N-acetylglucosamine kinase-like BadF-type ATPase